MAVIDSACEADLHVLDAVRALSARQQAVVVLAYWDDLTPAAIATRLESLKERSGNTSLAPEPT